MIKDCCYIKCGVALLIIVMLIATGDFSFAGNPLTDLFNKKKEAQEKPVSKKPTGTQCSKPITSNEFVYMMTHKDVKTVRAQYNRSDKSMCFLDYLKGYDRRYVEILKVNQQLQFSGLSFKCYCGCVKPGQWNHHEVPSKYKIDTRLTLTVNGNTSKCLCGCK